MNALGYAAWRLRHAGAWFRWLLAWGSLTLGFRWFVFPELSWVGVLDDVALLCALCGITVLAARMPRVPRLGLLTFLVLFVTSFNLANAAFYAFFDSFLNVDSWRLLSQVGGAKVSMRAVLTPRLLVQQVGVPLCFCALALASAVRSGPRRVATPGLLLLPLCLGLMAFHAQVRLDPPLNAENNGLLGVGRQWFRRTWAARGGNEATRARILSQLHETYVMPPPLEYRTGTDARYPLLRVPTEPTTTPEKPLNVVIILMESVRLMELGIGGPQKDKVAPNLDRLAREGLYFPTFYANAHQTVRGEFVTLCGQLPNYGGGQIYSVFPELSVACLPSILKAQGYQTHWISSFSADYGNKRRFLSTHGVDHFSDGAVMAARHKNKRPTIGWGPSDEDLMEFAVAELDRVKPPFFSLVMTLSNHHPFNAEYGIPRLPRVEDSEEFRIYKDYVAGMQYTDHAVGHFFDLARKHSWFKNTLFVILGDHGIWVFPERGERHLTPAEKMEAYHRVPLILYSPAHLEPRVVPTLGSQVDLAPTLLDLLGVKAANSFEGVSLLQDVGKPRVVVTGNEGGWNIRRGDEYCYFLGAECFSSVPPACPQGYRPKRSAHACFQTPADMLDVPANAPPVDVMSPRDGSQLVKLGHRITDNHSYLLLHDAFFPKATSP
jgi:glucan phosphoethanolaminetransferase (alkaline phosphatase superfamily)